MYGNGCAGSTASGVSTGKMRSSKTRVSCACASASSSSHAVNATPASWSAGAISFVNAVGLAGHQLLDPGADRAELLDLVEAVGRGRAHADRELFLQARDPDLEELVDVAAEDREELRPLEQRDRRVLGEREDARLELEHRQLPVQVAGALPMCWSGGLMGQSYGLWSAHPLPDGACATALGERSRRARADGRRTMAAYGYAHPPRVDDVHAVRPARARPRGRDGRRRLRDGVARRARSFFDVGVGAARPKVLLYLLLTMAPVRGRRPGARALPRPDPGWAAADGRGVDGRARASCAC